MGAKLEVVHVAAAGIAIVTLLNGKKARFPEEIAGEGGRHRDSRMTLWEKDGGVLLWIDGKLVFNGRGTH